MRAIAACSVLVFHVWLYGYGDRSTPPGIDLGPATNLFANLQAGVTLFFVLSGYLLFRPYAAAVLRGRRWPSAGAYLRNRALRILPAYWFILTAVAVVFQRDLLLDPARYLANALFLREFVPAYSFRSSQHDPTGGHSGLGIDPAWSLAIEVFFYLVLPLLGLGAMWLVLKTGRRVLALTTPVTLMLGVGVGAQLAARFDDSLGYMWGRTLPPYAGYFGVGMGLAVAHTAWEGGLLRMPPLWRPASLLGGIAVVLVGTKLWYMGRITYVEDQGIVALGFALLLGFVVTAPPRSWTTRLLDWPPVVAVGLASYSIFLWHDPLVRELRDAGLTYSGATGFVPNLLLIAFVTGFAATLTYRYVEKPALARKRTQQPGSRELLGNLTFRDGFVRARPGALEFATGRAFASPFLIAEAILERRGLRGAEVRNQIPPELSLFVRSDALERIIETRLDDAIRQAGAPITVTLEHSGSRLSAGGR